MKSNEYSPAGTQEPECPILRIPRQAMIREINQLFHSWPTSRLEWIHDTLMKLPPPQQPWT